jgi:hypothetical protein
MPVVSVTRAESSLWDSLTYAKRGKMLPSAAGAPSRLRRTIRCGYAACTMPPPRLATDGALWLSVAITEVLCPTVRLAGARGAAVRSMPCVPADQLIWFAARRIVGRSQWTRPRLEIARFAAALLGRRVRTLKHAARLVARRRIDNGGHCSPLGCDPPGRAGGVQGLNGDSAPTFGHRQRPPS